MDDGYLRIGEFSDRVGISADLLRAWERRYGVLEPDRSSGGFRLYSDADVARVRRMASLIDEGLSAAEAARVTLTTQPGTEPERRVEGPESFDDEVTRLRDPLLAFDDQAAQQAFDRLLSRFEVDTVLAAVVLPLLQDIGDRWSAGDITVAQEHYATHMIRARLLGLARGWGGGIGPCAVLATAPGEEHDLGLIAFGLSLWRRGWRIVFLGANTPANALADTVASTSPDLVVVTAIDPDCFDPVAPTLRSLTPEVDVAIGGAGATRDQARATGARLLDRDPVTTADEVTRRFHAEHTRSEA